jgi:hypothetical protein
VFSAACDSSSITSIALKWQPFGFIYNRENRKVGWVGDINHVVFGKKNSWLRRNG